MVSRAPQLLGEVLMTERPNNRLESALSRPTRKSAALLLATQPER